MTQAPSTAFRVCSVTVRAAVRMMMACCMVLFVGGFAALATDVVLRYFFNSSIVGLHEVVGIGFTVVYLFGAAAIYSRNEDVVVELLFRQLPETGRKWAELCIVLIVGVTMAVVLEKSWELILDGWHDPTPALLLPASIYWVPLAISSALIVASCLLEAWAIVCWIFLGVRPMIWPHEGE